MMIPVRCFTCGRVVGSDYEQWKTRTAAGEDGQAVLNELDVTRFCCRRMIVSQVDTLAEAARYE